jgi:outer membrane lipoprotein-sorting protein
MMEPLLSLRLERPHRFRCRRFVLTAFLVSGAAGVVAPAGLPAQDERAYEVLEAASQRYWALNTLCAHFHQEIEVTLLGQTRSGEGTLCQRQPDEFSMRFSDPDGDLVVVDGEFLWTFYPSMDVRQVMRFAAAGAEGRFNFYKNLLDDPRGRFDATYQGVEELAERPAHKLTVTPRDAESFRSAVVWVDTETDLIVGVDVHDANESIRRVRLTDIRVDVDVPDDEFRFVPPPGARVLSR